MSAFPLDELLRLLNGATDNGGLIWSQTAEENTFRTEVTGIGLVRVSSSDLGGYTLTFVDQGGMVLNDFFPATPQDNLAMEELFYKARGQALAIDEKLNGLVEHLRTLVKGA